jgi:hypothetical protein
MEVLMKKVLFALGAFGFMATAAADEAPADERQDVLVDEGLLPGGFYYGLGLGIANVGVRNEYTYGTAYKGYTAADGTVVAAEPVSGADVGYTEDEVNAERTRLGGAFVVGFGRKLPSNNLYLALEAGLDFARNTTFSEVGKQSSRGRSYDCKVVRNGLVPSLAARIGYIACDTGILTYLKVGATLLKQKETYYEYSLGVFAGVPAGDVANSEHKISQAVPTLGIGLEKAFARKLTARLECEYQFNKSKVKDFGRYGSTKLSSKGDIVVRVMFCHNLKVGI